MGHVLEEKMKASTKRKLSDIRGRVKDLKSTWVRELKAKGDDERLIPRVSAIVVREGRWLAKLCRSLTKQLGQRADRAITDQDKKSVDDSEAFFNLIYEDHEDDVSRNLFIYRVDCGFISHLEKLVVVARKLEAHISAAQAANLEFDPEAEEELNAEMVS